MPTTRRLRRHSGSTAPIFVASTSSPPKGRSLPGRLAELMGLTSGAMTSVLDRLESAGYVRRVRDTGDRRRVHVELTPKLHERAWPYYQPLARDVGEALRPLHRRAARADPRASSRPRPSCSSRSSPGFAIGLRSYAAAAVAAEYAFRYRSQRCGIFGVASRMKSTGAGGRGGVRKLHVHLVREAVALAQVARRARGDDVLPDRVAAARARDHVVERQPPARSCRSRRSASRHGRRAPGARSSAAPSAAPARSSRAGSRVATGSAPWPSKEGGRAARSPPPCP